MNEQQTEAQQVMKTVKKYGTAVALGLGLFVTGMSSFTTVESGELVRIQSTMNGNFEWHQTEGMKFKVPFFSRVDNYNAVSTICVSDDEEIVNTASAVRAPLMVTFADNYGGLMEACWRVRLSTSPDKLEQMHQEVKSQRNLEGNTFQTFAKDMLSLTTDQFLAQDFMQGGKGAFKQRLQDQADNGMLQTRREKVEVEDSVADQSLTGERDQNATAKQFQYKVVIQTDDKGIPLRRPHSLTKYGITVSQVDLGEFAPMTDLQEYVATIKRREKERADMIADQRKEREAAVNAQLKGETARISAKNKALMEKDREVIQAQKQVELAQIQADKEKVERQKVADLAVIDKQRELQIAKDNEAIETVERQKVANLAIIDKQRELQIAQANEGIQSANYQAALYEAKATKEKGFAEAAVAKAKLQAKSSNEKIYLAELSLEEAKAIAAVLPQVKIDTPDIVMSGNGQGNGVSDLLSTKLVQDVVKTVKSNK